MYAPFPQEIMVIEMSEYGIMNENRNLLIQNCEAPKI